MRLKLKGKTVLVEIPPCTPLLDPGVAQSRWGSEANELWLRWDTDRDLYALRKLLELRHPPYDLIEKLKRALDEYLDNRVDLAVALAGGGRGRHAQPRTRAREHEEVEIAYVAVLSATAQGWRGCERFRKADDILRMIGQPVNQYPQGHSQRLPYIRRVYYRRKREKRPLDLEHKNLFRMYCSFLDKAPHGNGTRIEPAPEVGGFRMFVSEFDERTETWRETGESFVIQLSTRKDSTLKTAKRRSR